ncbi:MAG: hypothetical protein HY530_01010 [Chloroflexi bacterium]|nr:hypothetical protein [Chloroflexota bacterium]
MSIAGQLYQLQEVDSELESNEQALRQAASQLGESQAVVTARSELASEQQRLEELRKQQHTLEWEIDDLAGKLAVAEETLYSGRIKSPKELGNLQHEADLLKAQRRQLEDKALEIMEQVEQAASKIEVAGSRLKDLEAEWRQQQQQLSAEVARLEDILSQLRRKWEMLSAAISPPAVELYNELKRQKGQPVARVEQGMCRGCRISLPTSEVQQAKSGNLVQCSNCGRILFLA